LQQPPSSKKQEVPDVDKLALPTTEIVGVEANHAELGLWDTGVEDFHQDQYACEPWTIKKPPVVRSYGSKHKKLRHSSVQEWDAVDISDPEME
jgi:hypothetical protein